MSEHGITVAEANAGQVGTPEQQVSRLRAEVAALRQRAEAAERDRQTFMEATDRLVRERDFAVDQCNAERDLKRIAYAKLDEVRTVVEEKIIPALETVAAGANAADLSDTGAVMRLRSLARPALAAARKTLEDEQREGVTT